MPHTGNLARYLGLVRSETFAENQLLSLYQSSITLKSGILILVVTPYR